MRNQYRSPNVITGLFNCDPDDVFTIPKAAEYLKCSRDYIEVEIKWGRLAAVKKGNRYLLTRQACDLWLERRRIKQEEQAMRGVNSYRGPAQFRRKVDIQKEIEERERRQREQERRPYSD